MKRMLTTIGAIGAIALGLGGVATAQTAPGDPGSGEKLGIQQLNNSGQIGSVTLLSRGATTLVNVVLDGAPGGRTEAVTIHRGSDCETVDPKAAYRLNDLKGGRGTSRVNAPIDRLMSGNYSVLVYSGTQSSAHAVACGHLYR
ncbi:MAG: hypothetical protein NVSMB64_32280 [Candidatus Velthaea sp.]